MNRTKYAIIGCGSVSGNRYFNNLGAIPKGRLTAVCDEVEVRAKHRAEEFGIPYYKKLDDLLMKGDFDLLVTLTNIQSHFPINLKALKNGKHVYTQKPMTVTTEEATTLINEAAKRNLKLVAEAADPITPVNRTIRKLLDSGAIGKVAWIRATCTVVSSAINDNWPTEPSWKYKKGAGPRDPGIERLHALTALLGPAQRVTAMSGLNQPEIVVRGGPYKGKHIKVEEDDITLLTLDFGDSIFAFLDMVYANQRAIRRPVMEIYGHTGAICHLSGGGPKDNDFVLELYRDEPERGIRGWMKVDPIPPLQPDPSPAVAGLVHAIDCIIEDKKPILSGEHARHCIEIVEKAIVAARTGMTQKLETTF
ncbi:MAG: hypothetical protein GH144_11480 [Clostridia bacterium]|nr:hypothetical protein [Clostridia bacterium]